MKPTNSFTLHGMSHGVSPPHSHGLRLDVYTFVNITICCRPTFPLSASPESVRDPFHFPVRVRCQASAQAVDSYVFRNHSYAPGPELALCQEPRVCRVLVQVWGVPEHSGSFTVQRFVALIYRLVALIYRLLLFLTLGLFALMRVLSSLFSLLFGLPFPSLFLVTCLSVCPYLAVLISLSLSLSPLTAELISLSLSLSPLTYSAMALLTCQRFYIHSNPTSLLKGALRGEVASARAFSALVDCQLYSAVPRDSVGRSCGACGYAPRLHSCVSARRVPSHGSRRVHSCGSRRVHSCSSSCIHSCSSRCIPSWRWIYSFRAPCRAPRYGLC
jgi:hypothetical protein